MRCLSFRRSRRVGVIRFAARCRPHATGPGGETLTGTVALIRKIHASVTAEREQRKRRVAEQHARLAAQYKRAADGNETLATHR